MVASSNFEKTVDMPASKHQPTTVQRVDRQVFVDYDMKKRWEAGKDEKEKTAALITVKKMMLHDLNQVIGRAINDLVQLMEQYACVSLTGCFSMQVGNAVGFLEQKCRAMEQNGNGQDKLEVVKENLDHMKRKLELLRNAMGTRRKESVGMGTKLVSETM